MKARLIRHVKVVDELNNIIEIRMWELPNKTKDKPHGCKYSLVYIVEGERVIGYDNSHGQGDHRHYKDREELYSFVSLRQLAEDFYNDIEKFKKGEL